MKNKILIILIIVFSLNIKAQNNIVVELPEVYELSNIVLALTNYGKTDEGEVQKNTKYYQKVLEYFEPVKNHPLLDSVNYSREKWESYLSFRTDAYAFSFDKNNKLTRSFKFYTNRGFAPFDKNLALINDFVEKSNFRKFYTLNKDFYNVMTQNYKNHYFVDESIDFLNKRIGKPSHYDDKTKYLVVLSPLIHRMNCSRLIDENTTADFPSASKDFIDGVSSISNINSRVVGNHMIFTETDHGYVNPISYKYSNLISKKFNTKIWDSGSGYTGISCFNEYMTWAVYDLFIKEKFPKIADSIAIQWQYQNANRGFYAQNLFAEKVYELYSKNKNGKFENIYKPLLRWAKKIENKVTLPTLINNDGENFKQTDLNNIQIEFSEKMNVKQSFAIEIIEFKNDKRTGNKELIEIKNAKWSNKGRILNFSLKTDFEEFALIFNWWGNDKPLISSNGIFLKSPSRVFLKK